MKTKVAFAAALILAIAAAIGAKHIIDSYRREMVDKQIRLVFADTDLKAGDTLVEDKVSLRQVAGEAAEPGQLTADMLRDYTGQKLVRSVPANYVLKVTDFYTPQSEVRFVRELPKEFRAISIPVDQVAGVAGLIQPRDRVDVLATIAYPANTPGGGARSVLETLTVLENVTVLAIDNRTAEAANIPERFRREGRSGYTSVTLSVTPDEARIVTLAQAMSQGMLTLTLRNPADDSSSVERVNADALWDAIGKAAEQRRPKAEATDTEANVLGK